MRPAGRCKSPPALGLWWRPSVVACSSSLDPAVEATVGAKVVQTRLGHASIRTTLDTHGHLFEGLDKGAADALDDIIQNLDVGFLWG